MLYLSSKQQRRWSDCVDAEAQMRRLFCAFGVHIRHTTGFLMMWLTWTQRKTIYSSSIYTKRNSLSIQPIQSLANLKGKDQNVSDNIKFKNSIYWKFWYKIHQIWVKNKQVYSHLKFSNNTTMQAAMLVRDILKAAKHAVRLDAF